MNVLLPLLAITSFLLPPDVTPGLPDGPPSSVGVDAERLEEALQFFATAVDEDRLKGAVVLVARDGVVIAHRAWGLRDVEDRLAMERDSLFRMASNTKPVVAAGVLALVEDGGIRLSEPVGTYLPAFRHEKSKDITVHQLLTHTSGMRIRGLFLNPLLEPTPGHEDRPNLRDEVDRFAELGAEVEPGTSYAYSNPGYNTLGALIETVSGLPLEKFLFARFYDPLGMTTTSHQEVDARLHRMCTVYRKNGDEWTTGWRPGDPPDLPFVRASGGMISTARDYARFCQMILDGGQYAGRRYLVEETVALMRTPHTMSVYAEEALRQRDTFYGYGWSVDREGVFSHGGSDGTYAWVDPTRRLIGIVFTQSPGGDNPRADFRRLLERACDERPIASRLNRGFLDPKQSVQSFVDRFERESREIAKHRDAIAAVLGLSPGMEVADIGAGTGLFLPPLCRAVGDEGKVYAVDIAPKFIDHLAERARREGYAQVEPVLCTIRSAELPDASVDAAFVCDTYHHFDHPMETLASLMRAIRPGGRLVVVDFERIPGVTREWVLGHVRAGKEVFRSEIERAGFVFESEPKVAGLEENYVLVFRRP